MNDTENEESIDENNILNKSEEEVESDNSKIPDAPSNNLSDSDSRATELPTQFVSALSSCKITSIKERQNSIDVHDDLQGLAPSDDEMEEETEKSTPQTPNTPPVDKEIETYFLPLDDVNMYLNNFIKNCHFDTYVFRVQIIQDLASKLDDQQNTKRPILDEILKLFKRPSDNNFTCYEYVCVYHLFNLKVNKGIPIPKKIPKFLVNLRRVIPEVKKKMKEIENFQNTINRLEREIENVKNDKALSENTLLNVTNQYFTSPAIYSSSSSKQTTRKQLKITTKLMNEDSEENRPLSTTAASKSKKRISFSECDFVFNPDKGTVERTPPRNQLHQMNNNNNNNNNGTSPSRLRSVSGSNNSNNNSSNDSPTNISNCTLSSTLSATRLAAIKQMNGRKKKSPLLQKKNDDSDDSDSSISKSPSAKKTKPSLIKKPTKRTVTKKN